MREARGEREGGSRSQSRDVHRATFVTHPSALRPSQLTLKQARSSFGPSSGTISTATEMWMASER